MSKTIDTNQFYTGPKGDNYIISEIKSNIEELEKDLKLKENSPNPVGSLVMISYGDVEGTNAYKENLKTDQSAGYFDLNSTLWLKQILTDEEINNSEQAIISSDNWCYILQTSLRGKTGKALNFVGSFNVELGKENEEGKWWNTKFLEGSGEKGITDADFLKALKEKYLDDWNNLQFADTIVGNFNLYKDGVGEEFEKIYMVVYYIRSQTALTKENCFILNKISGVYTPPKNIISIEGFSFDTESNKILIGQVSKNNILNTKNNQILIGNNLDLSSAPEGAIALGQYNSQTSNTLFAIGDGSSNSGNSNLIEIIKEKDSSNLNKELYELKLKGNTVFSTKEENLNLAEKVEKISNIPFIKDLLDENFQGSDNAVFVSNGYWREINNNQQKFLTAESFEETSEGSGTYKFTDLKKVEVEHFVPSQPINPILYCPSGIKEVQCKISDSTGEIVNKTFTNNNENFSEFQVNYFSDSDEKNIYPHRTYNIEFLVTLYKEGQKYYNNEIQVKFNINNFDFRNSKNNDEYILPVIFLSFGQEIFSRPNLNWTLSPSSIEDFVLEKKYKQGDKFKYDNNYYMAMNSVSFDSEEKMLESNWVVLINSIYDLNKDWEEPNPNYYYYRHSLIYYKEKFLCCERDRAYTSWTDDWFTIDEGVNTKKEAWILIDQVVNHSPTLWNFIKNKFWKIGDIRDDVIIVDFDFDDKYNNNFGNFSPIPSLEMESLNFNTLPSGLTKAPMTLLILKPPTRNSTLNTKQSYNIDGYYNQNFTPALRMDNNNDYNFNDLVKPVVKATKGKRTVEDGEKITTPIYSVHKYFTFSEVELLGENSFSIPGETGKDRDQYSLFKDKKYLEILKETVYFTRSPYRYYGSWIAFSNKAQPKRSFKLPYGDEKLDNTILDVNHYYGGISPAPAVYWMFCI